MSRTIISILLLTFLNFPESPGLKENQKEFILGFAPKIFEANEDISKTRSRIIQIRTEFKSTGRLSNEEEVFISRLSKNYGLNTFKLDDEKDHDALLAEINALLLRVDIIPPRLIMAQAIIESGWGKSYFAKEANNYFGVHCYNKGCGIPPKGAPDAGFEVKKYHDLEAGIADYMDILNSYSAYEDFRKTRAEMRKNSEKLDPVKLAGALTHYSQKGEAYVKLIREIIQDFLPGELAAMVKSMQ